MRKSISKLETVTTVGLDLAKNVFQVQPIDAQGVVVNKAIGRGKLLEFSPRCRNASGAWRPVRRNIIGGARSPRSGAR